MSRLTYCPSPSMGPNRDPGPGRRMQLRSGPCKSRSGRTTDTQRTTIRRTRAKPCASPKIIISTSFNPNFLARGCNSRPRPLLIRKPPQRRRPQISPQDASQRDRRPLGDGESETLDDDRSVSRPYVRSVRRQCVEGWSGKGKHVVVIVTVTWFMDQRSEIK